MASTCAFAAKERKYRCSTDLVKPESRHSCKLCESTFCEHHIITDVATNAKIDVTLRGKLKTGDGLCYSCALSLMDSKSQGVLRKIYNIITRKDRDFDILPCFNNNAFRVEIKNKAIDISSKPSVSDDDYLSYVNDYVALLAGSLQLGSTFDWSINELLEAIEQTARHFREDGNLFPGPLDYLKRIRAYSLLDKVSTVTGVVSIVTLIMTKGAIPAVNVASKETTGKSIAEHIYSGVKKLIPYEITRRVAAGIAIECIERLYITHSRAKTA